MAVPQWELNGDRAELALPAFVSLAVDLTGEVYTSGRRGARGLALLVPAVLVVLHRQAGAFFLRSKGTAFPGQEIPELSGFTGGRLRDQINANILNLTGARRRFRDMAGRAFSPRAADAWRPDARLPAASVFSHRASHLGLVRLLHWPAVSHAGDTALPAPEARADRHERFPL